jgi:hypothetical protein
MSEPYKCPGCGKEFDKIYTVPSNVYEPFLAVDAMKGIQAYGTIQALKTVICHVVDHVHFAFLKEAEEQPSDCPPGQVWMVPGEERLVKIEKFNQELLASKHEHHATNPQVCHEEECDAPGIPCYYNWSDADPDDWYCHEHCYKNGFCPGCGLFNAGFESFDFAKDQLCESCHENWIAEFDEDEFDYEDEFDFE